VRQLTSHDIDRLRALNRHRRNVRPLVAGQGVTFLGDAIAFVTLPLFVLSLTGRGLDLGLTAAAETIPLLLFGFMAGVIVDRAPIRVLLVGADMIRVVAFTTLGLAVLAGTATVPLVLAVAFAGGVMATFFEAAFQALVVAAVDREQLVAMNTRLSFVRTVAFAAGPAIGGILATSQTGFALAFMVNALTFAASAIFVMRVRFDPPPRQQHPTHFWRDLATGLVHIRQNVYLRWSTVGVTVTNLLFAPLEALLALFVSERIAPPQLPFMEAPLAVETTVGLFYATQALLGALGVAAAPRVVRMIGLGRSFLVGVAAMGAGFGLVVAIQTPWAVLPAGAAIAGVGLVNVSVYTMRQQLTAEEMLGRVSAAGRTLAYLFIPIGAATGGALVDEIGLSPVYAFGSLGAVVLAVALTATALGRGPEPVPVTQST
jgi:MFS family permease